VLQAAWFSLESKSTHAFGGKATESGAAESRAAESRAARGRATREQIIRMPAQLAQLLIGLRRQQGIFQARLSALELHPGRFTLERLLLILAGLDMQNLIQRTR
jgi:HTH-type transcriptional regulator/antitoxin HipB